MADAEMKSSWKADIIIGVSAFLISMATFFVLIYQTQLWQEQNQLARKQQYASVLPYLEIWYNHPNSKNFTLVVGNNGVGPAFIKSVSIQYKGTIFQGDPEQFLSKVLNAEGDTIQHFSFSRVNPGRVLPAGQEIHLLNIENDLKSAQKLKEVFGENIAALDIIYESVYEETWQTKGLGNPPIKLTVK